MPAISGLDNEIILWESYWINYKGSHPNTVSQTLQSIPTQYFNNITVALRLLATLPVTTCECERSFSAMRRLKNYTRSKHHGSG